MKLSRVILFVVIANIALYIWFAATRPAHAEAAPPFDRKHSIAKRRDTQLIIERGEGEMLREWRCQDEYRSAPIPLWRDTLRFDGGGHAEEHAASSTCDEADRAISAT